MDDRIVARDAEAPEFSVRHNRQLLCAVFDLVSDGVVVWDRDGSVIEANRAARAMLGLTDQTIPTLDCFLDPAARSEAVAWLRAAPTGSTATFEWRGAAGGGQPFRAEATIRRVLVADRQCGVAVLRNAADHQQEAPAAQVRRDALTSLPNRMDFHEALEREIARCERYGGYLCVALGAIDGLGDGRRRDAEDAVVIAVANFIRSRLRQSDYLACRDRGEFAFLLHDSKPAGAAQMLNRLRAAAAHLGLGEAGRPVTLSFGVTAFRLADTPGQLLSRVEGVLDLAKERRGDRVVVA